MATPALPPGPALGTILHASPEVVGFAKTGGLADVVGSLPRALQRLGRPCSVVMPLYRCTRTGKVPLEVTGQTLHVEIDGQVRAAPLWHAMLPGSSVPVYFVEQPDLFERDDPAKGTGLYQLTRPDQRKVDYEDNDLRFAFFSRAVLEVARVLEPRPALIHNHDWQCGLVAAYLRSDHALRPEPAERAVYERLATVFTIHNIAYQGLFPGWSLGRIGLPGRLFNMDQLEYYGHVSFLKAGIVFSDRITTVSPSYAREIQTPYFGFGMQGILTARNHLLSGIVNGADYAVWDPAVDPHLAVRYDVNSVHQNKPLCKQALQRRFTLPEKPDSPLVGMISRLVDQKGWDLLSQAADRMLQGGDLQWVVLGDGDPVYHDFLTQLRQRYPEQVGVHLGFSEPLAHQIEAGADIYLMPSYFEPSGLNQLYSLKYGTVPVVRATGGLADTIVDFTPANRAAGTATGFRFVAYSADAFLVALRRALEVFRGDPPTWRALVQSCMRQDWSWDRSAAEYDKLYRQLLDEDAPP